jgi:hypothetical protein
VFFVSHYKTHVSITTNSILTKTRSKPNHIEFVICFAFGRNIIMNKTKRHIIPLILTNNSHHTLNWPLLEDKPLQQASHHSYAASHPVCSNSSTASAHLCINSSSTAAHLYVIKLPLQNTQGTAKPYL